MVAEIRRSDPAAARSSARHAQNKNAATYITKLPKAEHEAEEWQAAIEALMLMARGGPTMLARIGVMKELNRHHVGEFNTNRNDHHWGKRKLKRNQAAS